MWQSIYVWLASVEQCYGNKGMSPQPEVEEQHIVETMQLFRVCAIKLTSKCSFMIVKLPMMNVNLQATCFLEHKRKVVSPR